MTARGLLTAEQVATYLQVPLATLKTWRTRGGGPPFIRVNGKSIRYRPSDVEAWLDNDRVVA